MIPKDRQTLFKRKLKPISARNPITSPVMKILVRDDAFDIGKIAIGCRLGLRKHVLGIKDIEALIFHRAHIEITHGNNHEAI